MSKNNYNNNNMALDLYSTYCLKNIFTFDPFSNFLNLFGTLPPFYMKQQMKNHKL